MSEGTPRFVHISEAVKNYLLVASAVGAVILFVLWGRHTKTAELQIADAEAKLKAHEVELRNLNEEIRRDSARREKAEASKAEADVARDSIPTVTVRPVVQQTLAFKDVREIRIEPHFENSGKVDISIEEVAVEVYFGKPKDSMAQTIDRTNEMYDIGSMIRSYGADAQGDERLTTLQNQFAELSKECPHGSIFLIGTESDDIEWTKLPQLDRSRRTAIRLHPSQSAFETFVYVVTEGHKPHTGWFRFCVIVNPKQPQRQRFEFVIPIFRGGEQHFAASVSRPVTEASWEPGGSLLPTIQDK